MERIDITRGLAVTAVAALLVAGSPAMASAMEQPPAAADTVGSVVITPPDTQVKRPGQSTDLFEVTVRSVDQDPDTPGDQTTPIAGKTVTLTVDSGYFTPRGADLTQVPEDQGSTITVTTDENGVGRFKIAIARDTGFDDDGEVISTITATADGVSDTEDQLFVSSEPLNGSAVSIMRTSGSGPAVPGSETIPFDVYAFDEFGNPVPGETVAISSDSASVTAPATAVTDLSMDGDLEVSAAPGTEETATITASWMATERGQETATTFTDTAAAPFGTPAPEPVTVSLSGRNNGAQDDALLVKAPRRVAGATVVLRQTGLKNRRSRVVATGTANEFGNVRFVVADRDGRKFTQYRAIVRATDDSARSLSNRRRVR